MRGIRAVPLVLWVLGVALIADSVLRGSARVSLVVIVPVVSGQSIEFLLGVVALFAGFLTLPWLFLLEEGRPKRFPETPGAETTPPPLRSSSHVGGGGLILIGPVPILFGGWRNVSRRARWWLAIVGGVILVAFLMVVLVAVL